MKKLLIALTLVTSFSAFSFYDHGIPTDMDSLTKTPVGSILIIERDIIFAPRAQLYFADGVEYNKEPREVKNGTYCRINIVDKEMRTFNREVRLARGTELTIEYVGQPGIGQALGVLSAKTPSGNGVGIMCDSVKKKKYGGRRYPNIGEVRKALHGVMDLQFSEPLDI